MALETRRHNLPGERPRKRAEILLRVPALREGGRVIFPDLGAMDDDEFLLLVRESILKGHRVYVKTLPLGQAAVPIIKSDGSVSLGVSSEFRRQIDELRASLRRRK